MSVGGGDWITCVALRTTGEGVDLGLSVIVAVVDVTDGKSAFATSWQAETNKSSPPKRRAIKKPAHLVWQIKSVLLGAVIRAIVSFVPSGATTVSGDRPAQNCTRVLLKVRVKAAAAYRGAELTPR